MKIVIQQFLAGLRERGELDAILPDILSQKGFSIFSKPGKGTRQAGVDVAAVGKDDDGRRKVFLFSIKAGDLDRGTWDQGEQALRPSLNEILDDYIPNRMPTEYQNLPKVICICLGGEVKETVRSQVSGFTRKKTDNDISFQEWNGDRLSSFILDGVFSEQFLPKGFSSDFRKVVAFVDEPDVAKTFFKRIVQKLVQIARADGSDKARLVAMRQIYLVVWVFFIWARDENNFKGPMDAAEFALLAVVDLLRDQPKRKSKTRESCREIIHRLIQLNLIILTIFINEKVRPHRTTDHYFAVNAHGHGAVDVNLHLFDLLGRVATTGLWCLWFKEIVKGTSEEAIWQKQIDDYGRLCLDLVENNPALLSPLCDDHSLEIATMFFLLFHTNCSPESARGWIEKTVHRLFFAYHRHLAYPCNFRDYSKLARHPKEVSDPYRREATAASTLIPLLACLCAGMSLQKSYMQLKELQDTILDHTTLQFWLPGDDSEEMLYLNKELHGLALTGVCITDKPNELLNYVKCACEGSRQVFDLSGYQIAFPIIIHACRQHRLPLPPHFWIDAFEISETETEGS